MFPRYCTTGEVKKTGEAMLVVRMFANECKCNRSFNDICQNVATFPPKKIVRLNKKDRLANMPENKPKIKSLAQAAGLIVNKIKQSKSKKSKKDNKYNENAIDWDKQVEMASKYEKIKRSEAAAKKLEADNSKKMQLAAPIRWSQAQS